MKTHDKILPDTSIIIEGYLSENMQQIDCEEIVIHEAVIAELESQANKGRDVGSQGLEEIKKIREISEKTDTTITHEGNRPGDFEIKFAKSGEIDNLIRDLCIEKKATLFTADKVQANVAEAKGIDVFLLEIEDEQNDTLLLERYFEDDVMSVHLKAGDKPRVKKGEPGSWTFEEVEDDVLDTEQIKQIYTETEEAVQTSENGFIEQKSKGSAILQLNGIRILSTKPPVSDTYEITAVRNKEKLSLDEYSISNELKKRITDQAEGIIISGSPGQGKSTFAQALVDSFVQQDLNVKTLENPRDMQVSEEVTRYNNRKADNRELFDILLLSRPDKTVFDEIRNEDDFDLFADLRLAGIGMTGVIHAHKPLDTIHRFLTKQELGLIPQVVDTIIYIENGSVEHVYSLDINVKTPLGMGEADLSRPVVNIHDFETGELLFEIYSYGDQVMVVPVQSMEKDKAVLSLASEQLENELQEYDEHVTVRFKSDDEAVIRIAEENIKKLIGKNGENIDRLEEKYGVNLQVEESSPLDDDDKEKIQYDVDIEDNKITFRTDRESAFVDIYVRNDFLLSAKTSKEGKITMSADNNFGSVIKRNIKEGKKIVLKA